MHAGTSNKYQFAKILPLSGEKPVCPDRMYVFSHVRILSLNNNHCMFVTVTELANPGTTEDYISRNNGTNLSDNHLNRAVS